MNNDGVKRPDSQVVINLTVEPDGIAAKVDQKVGGIDQREALVISMEAMADMISTLENCGCEACAAFNRIATEVKAIIDREYGADRRRWN